MRRSLRKKVEPSGEADAVAKRIVRRRIRASVTRADAARTHTYASGLPLGGSIDLRRRKAAPQAAPALTRRAGCRDRSWTACECCVA